MKLVFFSDLHLDAPFVGMGPEVAGRRRQAVRESLLNIVRLADDVDADALLCGGDLYEHEMVTDDTMHFVQSVFDGLTIPVIVAPGNHDWFGRTSLYRRARWSPNVHIFETPALSPISLAEGITLWGAAHCAPAGTAGFLDTGFRVRGEGLHLALFHGSERGWLTDQGDGKFPHAPFDESQIAPAGLAHAFVGHYHRPKARQYLTYAGNPCPLTFGEDGERGAVVIELMSDGSVRREWRNVAAYQVHELTLDVSGSTSQQEVRDRLVGLVDGLAGCARVTLEGELGPDLSLDLVDSETLRGSLDRLVLSFDGIRLAYDFEAIQLEQTVRGQFVRDVMVEDIDETERRRILATGLRALGGRTDLEIV